MRDRRTTVLGVVEVLVLLACCLAVPLVEDETGSALRVSRTVLGDRTGFSPGYSILLDRDEDLARSLDTVASTGARWLRVDLDWSDVEEERGEDDWRRLDRVLAEASARGLEVLAVASFTPDWARAPGTTPSHPPADPQDYADFLGRAVERYAPRGIRTWEVWNEPNLPGNWRPGADVAEYSELLRRASAAVRAADPDAVVLSGGLAPAADGDGAVSPRTFVRELYRAGAAEWVDGLAVHPYSYPLLPGEGSPDDNAFQQLPELRRLMVEAGAEGDCLWITEFGAPTTGRGRGVTEAEQAEAVSAALRQAAQWPWAGPVLLYSVRDLEEDPGSLEDDFGVVERDYEPKRALDRLTGLLEAGEPVGADPAGAQPVVCGS